MVDELYDDVLNIMNENGFVEWFEENRRGKISPLKWCYDSECELKTPVRPPKGLTWLVTTYDNYMYYPNTVIINDEGYINPRHS